MIAFMLANLDFPPVSKLISAQYGLTNAQTGLVTSFFFIPYASMQIPGGFLADRYGSARTLLVATFIMGLAPLIFLYGGSINAVYASRAIAGASGGIVFPSMVRLLSQSFPRKELGRAMGLFGAANGVGQLVASSLLPLIVLGTNWRPPLDATVVYSLFVTGLLILPVRWSGSFSEISSRTFPKINVRGLFTRNMFALMLPNFASVAVVFASFAWAADFLTISFKISNVAAGGIVALIGLATIVGSYCGGISDRILGSRPTMVVSMILLFLFTLLFGLANSIDEAAILVFGIGFGANLYFATDFSLIPFASKQGLEVAGVTFGVFNTMSNVGSVIAPLIFGIILDQTRQNFSIGFAALAVFALLGILGSLMLKLSALHH